VSFQVDHLRFNDVGQILLETVDHTMFQDIMTHFLELVASLFAATGFAPASKPSAEDEAKAAAAQSVLIAASRTRHPFRIAAN
jgi:hypothetical protein